MTVESPAKTQPEAAPAQGRLLVVDDQETNLNLLGGMLARMGFDTVLASSGQQALECLERAGVDLILLDVLMPGLDGFEVCRRIRARPEWADIPVIFLSAADEKNLIVRALEVGGVDYVTKPFNQAELMSRVRTQLALKSARDHLRWLAEDKDELLGVLAHDLKNHLGGMQMSVRLLFDRARAQGDERMLRMAENILYSTEQMFSFVREFLANAAADRGLPITLESVCLNDEAAIAVRQHGDAAARKNIALIHEGSTDTMVQGDRNALHQVLDNLISNALKFSPSGKTVRVTVRKRHSGGATVRVADEGPGFTEEDRRHMFLRYRRLSARPTAGEPSTGLGLSIVRRLVAEMGGEIRCESTPGHGASFIVNLPPAPKSV